MQNGRMSSFMQGLWAEYLSCILLWLKGYRVLSHRFKVLCGEVDIIAQKGDTIVFIEVKKRLTIDQALYAVQSRQKARIQKAALYFLKRYGLLETSCIRFDVMCWSFWRWPVHVQSAWR